MTAPLVSVIIPTRGRPGLLKLAIQSALAQTYPEVEILVVENGASTPGKAVVEGFGLPPSKLRWLHLPAAHPSRARNAGIRQATGAYLAFLDDDDEWLPQKLAKQVAILDSCPDVGMVACRAWRIDEDGGVTMDARPFFTGTPSFRALVTQWRFIGSVSAVVIRRECVDRVGMFSERYRIAGDYELYLRVAREYRLALIEEPLFRYHRHRENLSQDTDQARRETLEVLRALRPSSRTGVSRAVIRAAIQRYCRWYYGLAVRERHAKRYAQAARHFSTALAYDPLIGAKIGASRAGNPVSRALRPYANLVQCGVLSIVKGLGEH